MAAEAPSKEELNNSILQKKEKFRERLAAFLKSQDEAKLSAEPVDSEMRCPESGVATRGPGVYGSPVGADTIETEDRNAMLRKQEVERGLEQEAKKWLEKVDKKKQKKKQKKKEKKEGKKEGKKEVQKEEKNEGKEEETKDYICRKDRLDAWLEQMKKKAIERESRMKAAGRRYVSA